MKSQLLKNILITGGLGYLGGRIAAYLKERAPGATIILTTRNKSKGLPKWSEEFIIREMDVCEEDSIAKSVQDIDVIIHLAALNEIDSAANPLLALEVNTKGTYNLLNMAKRSNVKRFIYFSTFHVYGKSSFSIITEDSVTRPVHPYAITHRAAEDFVNYFTHYHGIKTLILRLSNGYGYPMDIAVNRWTLVFNDLCKQAVTEQKMILRSSGVEYRDFISLHDIASAVYHFIFNIPDRWGDGIYNLGGECSMRILDVARRIASVYYKRYKKKIDITTTITESSQSNSQHPFIFSIEKLKSTGFHLKGDMETEILKTLEICEGFNIS